MSYILQSTGSFSNYNIKKNFKNFENTSICETVNHVLESGTGHDFRIVEPKDLHTLVKSTVHVCSNKNLNLTPMKMLSSVEMKVGFAPPKAASLGCDVQHLRPLVATEYSGLFDSLEDLKKAVMDHISKMKDDWIKSGKSKTVNNSVESKVPEALLSGAMFTKMYSNSTKSNGIKKDWEIKSHYGVYRLSAKAIAKMCASTELDWSKHIDNVRSVEQALNKKNINLVRHKMIATNANGEKYVIDNIYLPQSPDPDHSLAVISVDMSNLSSNPSAFTRKEMLEAKLDDRNMYSLFVSVPSDMFHKIHGSFCYELVRLHAPKLIEALGDVCNIHLRSQIYKGILKMRDSADENVAKLTAQQKGKRIRCASALREYQKELESVMTDEEKRLANSFVDSALQSSCQKLKCIEGDMFKNISRGNYEIGSINTKYDMKLNYTFNAKKGEKFSNYLTKELEVSLGNVWCINSHAWIIY